jgi:hypothetical protein
MVDEDGEDDNGHGTEEGAAYISMHLRVTSPELAPLPTPVSSANGSWIPMHLRLAKPYQHSRQRLLILVQLRRTSSLYHYLSLRYVVW